MSELGPAQPSAGASAAAATSSPEGSPTAGDSHYGIPNALPLSAERLLSLLAELREYQSGTCQERAEFRRERVELSSRLLRLDQELHAEDRIGQDLHRRIETLEDALRKEHLQYQRLAAEVSKGARSDGQLRSSLAAFFAAGSSGGSSSLLEPKAEDVKQVPEVLAEYLERLPKVKPQTSPTFGCEVKPQTSPTFGCEVKPQTSPTFGCEVKPPSSPTFGCEVRAQSCRETLRRRLREACIDFEPASCREEGLLSAAACLAPVVDGSTSDAGGGGASSSSAPGPRRTSEEGGAFAKAARGSPVPAWEHRWTLQSHLDGARSVLYDEQSGVLLSCGEDALIKGWDLSGLWRGAPDADELEPYVTLRGHTAPVLAMTYRPQDRMLFSAGVDFGICAWRLPSCQSYDAYGRKQGGQHGTMWAGTLVGHTDNVWDLQQHPQLPFLASASADGKLGLWAAEAEHLARGSSAMQASFSLRPPGLTGQDPAARDVPSCLSWVPADTGRLLAGYTSSRIALFDVRHGTQVLDMLPPPSNSTSSRSSPSSGLSAPVAAVTSVACHSISQLTATGHTDCCARLLDLVSGRFVGTMSDHTDVVTSISMDPTKAHCLVTGCHDGYVRSFDLRSLGRCVQQLRLHQRKYDEVIHCVHYTSRLLATAGADGNVNILLPS